MNAMKEVIKKKDEKENDQHKEKEETAKRVLADASGKKEIDNFDDDSDIKDTTRGPKRRCMNVEAMETDNGLDAFGGSVEKGEAARREIEQKL